MTNTTITLEQFHDLLADSYAVCANDTLYFVGYNTEDDTPYIADNDGEDYIDLSTVDGDIEVHPNYVFFYVQGEPMQMVFLQIKKPVWQVAQGAWQPPQDLIRFWCSPI